MSGFSFPNCRKCTDRCVSLTRGRKTIQGKHLEPMCCYLQDQQLSGTFTNIFSEVKGRIEHASAKLYPRLHPPSDQSLRNLKGGWFETLIAMIAWNRTAHYNKSHKEKTAIVDLPTAGTMPFWELYDKEAKSVLSQLFKSLKSRGINMTLSNPDFICVSGLRSNLVKYFQRPLSKITLSEIERIKSTYDVLRGKCRYDSVRFGIAVKSALRPDRRYQIVYEGSLMKAIVAHFKTRFWNRELEARYYGLVSEPPTPQDEIVFTNPSIDTIIDVRSSPRRAVDEIIACEKVAEAERAIDKWLGRIT